MKVKDNIKTMAYIVGICGLVGVFFFYIIGNDFGMGYGLASINTALIFKSYHKK